MQRLAGSLVVLAVLVGAVQCSAPPRQPNLLLIVLDTTRADHLGCYGHTRATSPRIDALAREGVRFDNAVAQSSLTPVSAGSFLTGTYPFRHGIRSLFTVRQERMNEGVRTLGEWLEPRRLRSAAFVSAQPMGSKYGLARGYEHYGDDLKSAGLRNKRRGLANPHQRRADQTTELALDWLAEHGSEPFHLMVHYFDAHDPTLVPPREFLEPLVSFALPPELDRMGNLAGADGAPDIRGASIPQRIELYDAEIRFMDEQVGRIVDELDRLGVTERTRIVILGDHGEGLGQHDFWSHGLLYEEQLRVPFILRGPDVPRGVTVRARVRLVDLLPTLAELYAIDLGGVSLDGSSLVPLFAGGGASDRDSYAEVHHHDDDFLGRDPAMYALTAGNWKYVHRPHRGEHELYDLRQDAGETQNLFRADHPMRAALQLRLQELGALEGHEVSLEGLSEEELEALRSLGYLGD